MRKLDCAVISPLLISKLTYGRSPQQQSAMWKYTDGFPAHFKEEITRQLKINQDDRCAYCTRVLIERDPQRDHIAPRQTYQRFTFLPENLVLSCYHCNSTACKGDTDTIAIEMPIYEACVFSIIHPFFDEPSEHIQFVGRTRQVLIKVVPGSSKGKTTVRLFRLADLNMAKARAGEALNADELEHLPGLTQRLEEILPLNLKAKLRPDL